MAIEQLLQSKQGGIPPEMAALIQLREAAKVLKQSASAVTPSGQPTVASQDTQQALAMLLPEPPQQPGMEDLMPGIQQRAGQMAQAQQPVTQAQLQQAMAQQAQQSQQPVMAAEGGIITLPADIEMAEGGIVGYNGEERSDVELPVNERIKKAYLEYMAARERGEPLFRRSGAEALEDFLRGRPAPEAQRLAPEAAAVVARPRGQAGYGDEELSPPQETRDLLAKYPGQGRRGPAAETSPQRTRSESAPAAASAAPASGVASLMGPPVPSGSERQFGEAISAAGRMEVPGTLTEDQIRQRREAAYRARGIDPDFAKVRLAGIERLKAMDEAAKAEYAKSKKDIAWENLATRLAAMGGAPTMGEGARRSQLMMAQRYGEQRKADQQFNQLMRVNEEARIKELNAIDDMNRALANNDIAGAIQSEKDAREARNTKNMTEAKMRAQYAPQLLEAETAEKKIAAQKEEGRLDRESRERVAKWNDATQMAVAKARVEGKNPYDAVLHNVRAEFADWQKSGVGLAADAAARNAMYQEIYARHLKIAKDFDVKVPEGAGRGATGTKENPIKLD